MKTLPKILALFAITTSFLMTTVVAKAERIRLDRKHGEVNTAFQAILSKQISMFKGGVGKIDLGRESNSKGACVADMFVSPDTVYVVIESLKTKVRAEFYVDHPDDSFKDILFQALVKQDNLTELSVDKKTGGYKFISKGEILTVEVKQNGEILECEFDLGKSILLAGETE
jgi:hypothetical protein